MQTMSTTIDNRAVHLGFENQQFESGVKTSVDSLDKLKKSLDLTEQAKGLQNLSNSSKSFNLGGISEGVQNVSNRFSTFGIIGMTVLQNLTNKAIELGQKMLRAITVPVKMGFSEYELKMGSIQTIMAGTGESLETVNKYLNDLNTYSDRTIYSFSDMTTNIGKFTNAGVKLPVAVAAIQGIANAAALSGSNANEAARAMYNFAQAISSGYVKLIDWKSIELANMATVEFKTQLLETAVAVGTLTKTEDGMYQTLKGTVISATQGFNDSLQEQWMTTETLTQTLGKYADETTDIGKRAFAAAQDIKTFSQLTDTMKESLQSGWAMTWEIIVGDFEEAKGFFTYLNDIFGTLIQNSSDARNTMLEGWKLLGGRTLAFEAVKNVFDSLLSVMKLVGNAWNLTFPKSVIGGGTLFRITKGIKEFTDNLKPSEETAKKLGNIFRGLFSILDIGKMAIEALVGSFGKINTSGIKPLLSSMLTYLDNQASYIIRIRNIIKLNNVFGKALERVKVYFTNLKDSAVEFGNKFKTVFDKVKVLIEEVKNIFKGFSENFQNALNFDKIDTGGVTSFVDKFKKRFSPLEILFKGTSFIIGGLINFLKKAAPILLQLGSWIGKVLGQLGTAIMNAVSNVDFSNLFDTLNAGFLGAFILAIMKFVKSGSGVMESLSGMFSGVSEILDGVRSSLQAWQENLKSKTLLNIAIAVGILAASLLILSLIDSKKLSASLLAITGLFADLVASMSLLNKGGMSGGIGAAGLAATLIAMSLSLLLLTFAVKQLASIDIDELGNGLTALGLITTGLVVFMRTIGANAKSFVGVALSLIILAVGLEIIADVVKRLGDIDVGTLQNGLAAVGIVLLELAVFTQLAGKNLGIGSGLGIVALAGSILLISVAVEKFGKMDIRTLQQGLTTIGAILVAVAAFTQLVGTGLNLMVTAIGMTILGAAMLLFAEAITRLGNLSWEEVGKGMTGMAGALLAIVLALNSMPKNMIITAIGLVVVAGGISILADALVKMSGMSWKEIGRGLTSLAVALIIIGVAMYAMTGSIAGALALLVVSASLSVLASALMQLGSMSVGEIAIALGALAAAFTILGIAGLLLTPTIPTLLSLGAAIALIGVSVMLIGAGLLMFSTGLAALAVSGVAGATAFVAIVGILLGMIPMLIKALVDGIILFGNLIIQAAPVIGKALIVLIATLCGVIIASVPELVKALTVLLDALWVLVRGQVPQAVETVLFVIGEMLTSLAEKVPDFVQAGFDILIAYLQGIRNNIGEVVTVVAEIITTFLDAVAKKIPDIIQSGVNLMISFIEGITKAVKSPSNRARVNAAVKDLADAIIKGLTDGLLGNIKRITDAIGKISSAVVRALRSLLGIASPSKVTMEMGMYLSEGLAVGMLKGINQVEDAARVVAKKALDNMNKAVSDVNNSIYDEINISPVIRPVVDLTDFTNGTKNIERYFAIRKGLRVPTDMDKLGLAAVGMKDQNGSNAVVNPIGNTVNFYQTNTSPKALSSFDIYRETRNQLLMLKGLVIS